MKKFLNSVEALSILIGAIIVQANILLLIVIVADFIIGIPKAYHRALTNVYQVIPCENFKTKTWICFMKRWLTHLMKWNKYSDYQIDVSTKLFSIFVGNHNWLCDYFRLPDSKLPEEQ